MRFQAFRATLLAMVLLLLGVARTGAIEADPFWRVICSSAPGQHVIQAAFAAAVAPVASCGPAPTAFQELPSVGGDAATSVSLNVGYDAATARLCFVNNTLSEAPVIRVGAGQTLTINLTNTLHDTGTGNSVNCAIAVFGGDQGCALLRQFAEAPKAVGSYYPIEANQAATADGTTNLHTHGLFVSPQPCSDEVLHSTIYPANWGLSANLTTACQTALNTLTYTYKLPANHPAGLYWYHTHRHGAAEPQTEMGLVGAIIVEDAGDAARAALGVNDEVLIVTDTPAGCVGECDAVASAAAQPDALLAARRSARRAAHAALAAGVSPAALTSTALTGPALTETATTAQPTLDPRIDEVDQAGSCAFGATGAAGGYKLWTLNLNGAPVTDNNGALWPPDFQVLGKTMRPNQRLLFRLVNASANSFLAPEMALLHNNKLTVQPLEVFARDGVGLADASGKRHLTRFDVTTNPIIVPPSGRIEFVVHAPNAGDRLYLQSAQVNPGCAGNAYPERRLLLITSAGTAVAAGPAGDTDLLAGSRPLTSYLSTLGTTASVQRTFVLSEYGRDFTYAHTNWTNGTPTAADYNPSQVDFFLTQVYASDGSVKPAKTALVPFQMQSLTPQVIVHLHGQSSVTEEWLVENATLEIHAFHLHQIHFRDITVDSDNPDLQPLLDVTTVPAAQLVGDVATGYPGAPGWSKLRMTFTRQDIGEFVLHCHILEHEDNGMMAKIQVVAD